MQNLRKRRLQGIAAVLGAGTGYALMSILVKEAYQQGITPIQVIALQSWLASTILFSYALFFKRGIFRISFRALGIIALQGLVGALGTSLLYAYALKFVPVSVAILLMYLYPALVLAVGVVIWHKRVGRQELLALVLTLLGTTLASGILSGVTGLALIGIILGVAAAMAYAAFNILGEVALTKMSPLAAMCYSQWVCSSALVLIMKGDILSIPWQNIETWEIGLLLATVASILPFYLILFGIDRLGADQSAILSTFELPMTFIMAAVFLKEFPTVDQWMGGSLVMGGIILLNWRFTGEQSYEETLHQKRSN